MRLTNSEGGSYGSAFGFKVGSLYLKWQPCSSRKSWYVDTRILNRIAKCNALLPYRSFQNFPECCGDSLVCVEPILETEIAFVTLLAFHLWWPCIRSQLI